MFEKECISRLNSVVELGKIKDERIEILKKLDRYVEVSIPVRMKNGELKIFKGFRCQHNNTLGPYKGGIRFHPEVDLEEVKSLSFWMSMKNSLTGVPFGGGKGGVVVNAKELSAEELEDISRAYVQKMYPVLGEDFDVPAPDVNTNSNTMMQMADEYNKITNKKSFATFTGKPVENGGIEGRTEATGYGGVCVLDEFLKATKFKGSNGDSMGLTIAIQGLGNVATYFALEAAKFGHRIVAICDSKEGLYRKEGIEDLNSVVQHKKSGKRLKDYNDSSKSEESELTLISVEKLLELEVDILVPSAVENVINDKNANNIKAKVIVEMANGPTSAEADDILSKKGIIALPDILCNSGGVIVSSYEWQQNKNNEQWKKSDVLNRLSDQIRNAFYQVEKCRHNYNTTYRNAAYLLAVQNILDNMR